MLGYVIRMVITLVMTGVRPTGVSPYAVVLLSTRWVIYEKQPRTYLADCLRLAREVRGITCIDYNLCWSCLPKTLSDPSYQGSALMICLWDN